MARKVLFYTHAFGGGGAEVVFARLARAFAEAGDDVIFAADFLGPQPPRDRRNLRHMHLRAGHISATRELARLLRSERPDASFSALGTQNLKHFVAALSAGRLAHCVLGFHGFAVAEGWVLSRLCFYAAPVVTRLAAATICVSDALLADMRATWHASRRRTLRIYNPLAAGGIATPVSDRDEPPLVVACGRLVPVKRFPALVAAFAAVRPADARLVILGEGPDRPAIEAAVARLGLAARVELPGHVADPADWYRRAGCLVIASQSESFGLTALEALACGTPVVTTDCGGPAEIVGQGRWGRVVPLGDDEALAAAITATLADPGAEAPRRERAAAFALPHIHSLYAELADRLGRAPPARTTR